MSDAQCFYFLIIICEFMLPDYFDLDLIGSICDQKLFDKLVKFYLPTVYNHFKIKKLPLSMVTFKWFLCLYICCIPMEATLRIFDCLFYEGFESCFLFKMGLSILKHHEEDLLNLRKSVEENESFEYTEIEETLKLFSGNKWKVEVEKVLKTAQEDFKEISFTLIREMRNKFRCENIKEMMEEGKGAMLLLDKKN